MHQPSGADEQKLQVFKKGGFFAFDFVADELPDPCHHKYDQRKKPQRHETALVDGVIAPNTKGGETQDADGQFERQTQIEKGGQNDEHGGPIDKRLHGSGYGAGQGKHGNGPKQANGTKET